MRHWTCPAPLLLLFLAACRGKVADTAADTVDASDDPALIDQDGDGVPADQDCDDRDHTVSPGAAELPYNGVDDDCDPATPDDDLDGDGHGGETDCDDTNAAIHPDAIEVCNSLDDDCDGLIDDSVGDWWYADADGDGHGDPATGQQGCSGGEGTVANAEDCDDTNASALPGGIEVCDEADNNCDGTVDEGVTTTYYRDIDDDGHGVADLTTEGCSQPTGYAALAGDCDDADPSASPAEAEVCDGVDNDCDGTADEDDALDADVFYADADGDGYLDIRQRLQACTAPKGYRSYVPGDDLDCDDTDAAIQPGAAEVCNSLDDDCDGLADDDDPDLSDGTAWYIDYDSDGHGSDRFRAVACSAPSGYVENADDCDDTDPSASPTQAEVCDEIDNDCDGTVDEGVTTPFYRDADGDGHGVADLTTEGCSQPTGYAALAGDCDDTDPSASPAEAEVCDGVDNDCDGTADEDDALDADVFYADADGDGYGDASAAALACGLPDGHVENADDCDDADPLTSPAEEEVCNGLDDNCDGVEDEEEAVYGDGDLCAAAGCQDLLDARPTAADGLYWIDPDGGGAFTVVCDMTTDGGGWTQIIAADQAEIDASDPPDFTYTSSVWSGSGHGSAGDTTHISEAWSRTPVFSELMWLEGSTAYTEAASTSGSLSAWSKTSGTIRLNELNSHSYGSYGGRVFRSYVSAICNSGNASTSWGAGLGAVRSCQHSYGTLYYEFSSYTLGYTSAALWIR